MAVKRIDQDNAEYKFVSKDEGGSYVLTCPECGAIPISLTVGPGGYRITSGVEMGVNDGEGIAFGRFLQCFNCGFSSGMTRGVQVERSDLNGN